jgi:hypothetical protein
MAEQLEMFMDATTAKKKPKMTAKLKREAKAAIMEQVRNGWDPPEAVWKLLDWLAIELQPKKT